MTITAEETLAGANGVEGTPGTGPKETDTLARVNYMRYMRARDNGHTTYVKEATKFDKFYCDEHWEEKDKKKLDDEGRPALTINMVRPTVNAILGEQITRRAQITYKHKRGGSEGTATLLSKLYQSIADDNDMEQVESQVFADGIIQDRGFFDIRLGFNENMLGEIRIVSKDPKDVVLDPDAKEYDPSTWGEVFITGWLSVDEIGVTYGQEKADEIRLNGTARRYFGEDSVLFEDKRFGTALESGDTSILIQSGDSSSRQIRKVRVIDRQYYEMTSCQYFVDPETGDSKLVPADWEQPRITEFSTKYNLFVNRKMERKVRWVVTADHVVLHDSFSPYSTFTIVPYFPFFRRGRPTGVVRGLISPQELINKVSSQELHIVNTTANSGHYVEDGTLSGMSTDELKTKGSQTGAVITIARGRMEGIQKIQPNQIPSGLDRIGMKAQNNFRLISGVNESMLGLDSPEVSGVAIDKKTTSGSVQMDVPLANLKYTRGLVAKKILEIVQNFYTEKRVLQVADHVNPDQPMQEITINDITAAGEIINNISVGEYETTVSSQPSRDTYADGQFAEMVELRNAGVQIPDDRIIERSNLENKFDLAKEIRQLTGRGEVTPQQQKMQEMQESIAIHHAQLELAQLEADVYETHARAELTMAKAGAVGPALEEKISALESKIQIKREEIELRKKLALLTATNKLDLSAGQHIGKMNQMVLEHKLGDKNINGA